MISEAYERKYYEREILRTIAACREDNAVSIHLKNPAELKTLPSELWTLTHLKDLWLRWGAIEHLPKEIGRLKELENLELMSNQLQRLPNEIVSLSRLRFL